MIKITVCPSCGTKFSFDPQNQNHVVCIMEEMGNEPEIVADKVTCPRCNEEFDVRR